MTEGEPIDCLVIGGGPAGLTAAIYLGRFRRSVAVIDKGWSCGSAWKRDPVSGVIGVE